jgi:hypothetical protein
MVCDATWLNEMNRAGKEGTTERREIDMHLANRLCTILLAAFAAAALAPHAFAQEAGRDAAIAKCVKVAQASHPGEDDGAQRDRTAAYKACMTQAGMRP